MNEMRDRLSGHEYKRDVESQVSECSFDSYKQLKMQADEGISDQDNEEFAFDGDTDIGGSFHGRSLMLKVLQALQLNRIR